MFKRVGLVLALCLSALAQVKAFAAMPDTTLVEIHIATDDPIVQEAKKVLLSELKDLRANANMEIREVNAFSGKTPFTIGGPGQEARFLLDPWPLLSGEEFLYKALAPLVSMTGKRPLVNLSTRPLPGLAPAAKRAGLAEPVHTLPAGPAITVSPMAPDESWEDAEARFKKLRGQGHAVLSFPGITPLKAGALAALETEIAQPMARRLALDVWRAVRGQHPTGAEEILEREPLLVLNRATMNKLGLRPSLALLLRTEPRDFETPGEVRALSLKRAMTGTLDHAPALKANRRQLDAGEFRKLSANAQKKTRLTGALTGETKLGENESHTAEARLDAVKPITQRAINYQLKQAELDQALTLLSGASLTLRLKALTAQRYLDVLENREKLTLQEEQLAILRRNLRVAEDRVAVGVAAPEEAGRQRIQAENTLSSIASAQEALTTAWLTLEQLTGQAMGHDTLMDTDLGSKKHLQLFETVILPLLKNDPREALANALTDKTVRSHPDFEVFRTRKDLALTAERLIKANANPVLQAETSLIQEDPLNSNNRTDWQARLRLNVPIYSGGRDRHERNARLAEASALDENLTALAQSLRRDIAVSLERLTQAWQSALVLDEAAKAAAGNLLAIEARYSQGVLPLINLLDAERDLLTTKGRAITERYAFFRALITLFEQTGYPELALDLPESPRLKAFFALKQGKKEKR